MISRNHVDIQRKQRISQCVGKTPMVATSITSRSVIRSESCNTTFQRTHGCRCSSTQCNFSQNSAILGNHFEISMWSDQCFLGSACDVWRRLFRQHGRIEKSVRRHRVFDARAPAFLAWGISARTSGLLDEQHNQTCGSEYSGS